MSKSSRDFRETHNVVDTELFCLEQNGIAGSYDEGFLEILRIGETEDSKHIFLGMTSSKNAIDALYGLAGLKIFHLGWYESDEGKALRERIADIEGEFYYCDGGCMRMIMSAKQIIAKLDKQTAFSDGR
jgi:hypothetical protein